MIFKVFLITVSIFGILNSSAIIEIPKVALKSPLLDSMSDLMKAISSNGIEVVKKLCTGSCEINQTDSQGRTALFISAQEGNTAIIRELVKVGGIILNKPDHDGITPATIATINKNSDALKELLEASNNNNSLVETLEHRDKKIQLTPLARAATSGDDTIVKLLLHYKADPAAYIKKNDSLVPTFKLFETDDAEINSVVKEQEKVFSDRAQAFMDALRNNKKDEAKKLCALGLDVNARDSSGNTPLHWVAHKGDAYMAQCLISYKADINARKPSNNFTPHLQAVYGQNKEVFKFLIDHKADLHAKDSMGYKGRIILGKLMFYKWHPKIEKLFK